MSGPLFTKSFNNSEPPLGSFAHPGLLQVPGEVSWRFLLDVFGVLGK